MHPDLKHVGTLPPLDAPHHMRATEWTPYREGVVVASDLASGSVIDIGLDKVCNESRANSRAKVYVCIYVCVYTRVCIRVCVRACVHVRVYTCVCIRVYMCRHIHVCVLI